jgi:hypothetical protein
MTLVAALRAPDPEAVRESLERTFSRSEFSRSESVVDRILRAIGDFIAKLVPDVPIVSTFGGGISPVLGWLVIILGAALLLGAIIWIVLHFDWSRRSRARKPSVEFSEDEERSASEWALLGDVAERRGDWLEALRARYRELVMALVEGGFVPSSPGRTTGELRRDVASHLRAAASSFDELSDRFDLAYYGGFPIDAENYGEAKRLGVVVLGLARETKLEPLPPARGVEVDVM